MHARIVAAMFAGALVTFASRAALAQDAHAAKQPAGEPPPLPPPSQQPTEPAQPQPPTQTAPQTQPPVQTQPPPPTEPPVAHPRRRPPGPPGPPAPPPIDESRFVTVTLDADKPGVWLEAMTIHEGWAHVRGRWWAYGRVGVWHRVCEAPCTMRVPPDLRYRVGGPSVPASDTFPPGPPGGESHLRANGGSKGAQLGGAVLLFLGIPTAVVGIIATGASHTDGGRTGGLVTLGVGAAMSAIGTILIAANGTSVYDAAGRSVGSTSPKPALSPVGFVF